jgi:hypothetical protein
LPIWPFAPNFQLKPMDSIRVANPDCSIVKLHHGLIQWFEPFCATNEMSESWNVKDEIHEERYEEGVEEWGVYLSNKVFKVLANAQEGKLSESREYEAGARRWCDLGRAR